MADINSILIQCDALISRFDMLRQRSRHTDLSDLPRQDVTATITVMCDGITRFAPPGSYYVNAMHTLIKDWGPDSGSGASRIAGVLIGLRDAYRTGFLQNVTQLIHAGLFNDFIEMGEYLLSEGYKDPAAVIVGSVLEEHLRQLCAKHGIDITYPSTGKSKKADQLNADLMSQSVYSKLDQKSVTSWLDLRNKAAHGLYSEYTTEQVSLLIQSVRDFMVRVSA
jgi:hypothetical protein